MPSWLGGGGGGSGLTPSTGPKKELGRQGWYNNPGNIRVSPADWVGKGLPYIAGSSGGFETFETPELGVRAAVKNIQAKFARGIVTPAQLAPVLGPAGDKNNPEWLAQQYAAALGIGINDPIPNTEEAFNKLIPSITNIEKPYDARGRYTQDVYRRGIAAAFDKSGGFSLIPGANAAPMPGFGGRFLKGNVDMSRVNPALVSSLVQASQYMPKGYQVLATAGQSFGHSPGSQHHSGNAMDVEILSPSGQPISNRGEDSTGLYSRLAHAWYNVVLHKYPQLADAAAWGGEFETSSGSGTPDLMHFDFGGRRGRFRRDDWHYEDPSVEVTNTNASSNGPGLSFNWGEVHDAIGFLGRVAKEAGEHLHELGHGARNARAGVGGNASGTANVGPNRSISPPSTPSAAATP